jgi:hypothetical protein
MGAFFIFRGRERDGREGQGFGDPLLSSMGQSPRHPSTQVLILFLDLCVKTVATLGRNYPWQRPKRCPRCSGVRVWGHGLVPAYFDEVGSVCVYLKRFRCPECRVVIRVRPSGYFKRIQASVAAVRRCVLDRIGAGRWPPGSNPARQRHWLRALKRQVRAHLGMSYEGRIAEGFEELLCRGICAVSRSV